MPSAQLATSARTRFDREGETHFSGFKGAEDTLRAMRAVTLSEHGERSMLVRSIVQDIVRSLQPKAYMDEILAIRNWTAENVRYLNDPLHLELVATPDRLCREYLARGRATADCDEIACVIAAMCLQTGKVCSFVAVGFGTPGKYTHVFTRVKEPKSGKWIVCDPVAGSDEATMLRRVSTFTTVSLDEYD